MKSFNCIETVAILVCKQISCNSFKDKITVAQSAGAVEYTDCTSAEVGKTPPNECPGYDTKQSDGWGSSNAGALGNAEHPFIAIAPRSTRG